MNTVCLLSNKSLENAAEFKYLVMILKNQNCSHKKLRPDYIQLRIFWLPIHYLKTQRLNIQDDNFMHCLVSM